MAQTCFVESFRCIFHVFGSTDGPSLKLICSMVCYQNVTKFQPSDGFIDYFILFKHGILCRLLSPSVNAKFKSRHSVVAVSFALSGLRGIRFAFVRWSLRGFAGDLQGCSWDRR